VEAFEVGGLAASVVLLPNDTSNGEADARSALSALSAWSGGRCPFWRLLLRRRFRTRFLRSDLSAKLPTSGRTIRNHQEVGSAGDIGGIHLVIVPEKLKKN
jgi:hypothetical protein